ncbi:MAG TPA: ATP-binding protein [Mycobacteriales bacterium]|nr:ATP-binding protein [Mycobacteriales bacterium]
MPSVLLPYAASSAPEVRRHVETDLTAVAVPPEVVDDALLVVAELVSNAVLHGAPMRGGRLRVSWWVAAGAVHLEVCDGGTGPGPAGERPGARERHPDGAPELPPRTDEGGRGLGIVDLLTTRWGTTAPSPAGAVGVFAEIPLPGAARQALSRGGSGSRRVAWSARASLLA